MKLLTKTSIYYLVIAIPVILISGILCFFLISHELTEAVDEQLLKDKQQTEKFIQQADTLSYRVFGTDNLSEIKLLTSKINNNSCFRDTSFFDNVECELLTYRVLQTISNINGKSFSLNLYKENIETDDLVSGIVFSLLIIFGVLLTGFFLLNYWISKKLWSPFYTNISRLSEFDITSEKKLGLEKSTISEFKELNSTLINLTDKAHKDFISQKEFTENASHEIQTPLAIIRSNLDLLIQSERLGEQEMFIIQEVYESINKLSQLNKSLLLLSKIENNQFFENESVDIEVLINNCLSNFKELIDNKKIVVTVEIKEHSKHTMNKSLAEILISNLVLNAVRHNLDGGYINIDLTAGKMIFSNSGKPLNMSASDLFVRFKKSNTVAESTGLGMAIVKSIVDLYHFDIVYNFEESVHFIEVRF